MCISNIFVRVFRMMLESKNVKASIFIFKYLLHKYVKLNEYTSTNHFIFVEIRFLKKII